MCLQEPSQQECGRPRTTPPNRDRRSAHVDGRTLELFKHRVTVAESRPIGSELLEYVAETAGLHAGGRRRRRARTSGRRVIYECGTRSKPLALDLGRAVDTGHRQLTRTGVGEPMRGPGRGNHDVASAGGQHTVTHLEASPSRMDDEYLWVRMPMQLWSVPRPVVHEEHRDRDVAVFVTAEGVGGFAPSQRFVWNEVLHERLHSGNVVP